MWWVLDHLVDSHDQLMRKAVSSHFTAKQLRCSETVFHLDKVTMPVRVRVAIKVYFPPKQKMLIQCCSAQVRKHHEGILLRHRFWFSRSEGSLNVGISTKLQGMPPADSPTLSTVGRTLHFCRSFSLVALGTHSHVSSSFPFTVTTGTQFKSCYCQLPELRPSHMARACPDLGQVPRPSVEHKEGLQYYC